MRNSRRKREFMAVQPSRAFAADGNNPPFRSLRQSRYGARCLRTLRGRATVGYVMLWSALLLALVASAQGRAVNISNTWVLPEEGFPVFYRYFRDRISWYEADAVCQFHHANLVTVDTTAQYDAVRAYLKELDISSAVWVGLIRSNPDGDFTWTDYRGLSSDGYWSSAPDERSAPLCAAADPAADYRWEARACGGPSVASFICELPVPQWALGNEGCMVRAIPALTILYLPESAAVQLTSDCGLAGVKRVQCTGNVKRDDLLRDLSCNQEEEITSSLSPSSVPGTLYSTTEAILTEQDTTGEITTEESITTTHEAEMGQSTSSSTIQDLNTATVYKSPTNLIDKVTSFTDKKKYLTNNLQSNFIPKLPNDNYLTNEQLERIEDEKHMQHKMLHEEIARLGNLENIFTQPTDHFVPPLVMAKAKISDDMTVLSLKEKHAQQLAEEHSNNKNKEQNSQPNLVDNTFKINPKLTTVESITVISDKPLVTPEKLKDNLKKEKIKLPKKYFEKLDDPKRKIIKFSELKTITDNKKITELPITITESAQKETSTTPMVDIKTATVNDDSAMDLTIIIKDIPNVHKDEILYNYSGDVSKLEVIKDSISINDTEIKLVDIEATEEPKQTTAPHINFTVEYNDSKRQNITSIHDIMKITIIPEDHTGITPTIFELTTKLPVTQDTSEVSSSTTLPKNSSDDDVVISKNDSSKNQNINTAYNFTATPANTNMNLTEITSTEQELTSKELIATTTMTFNLTTDSNRSNNLKDATTTFIPPSSTTREKVSTDVVTEIHDEYELNNNSSETIDDFQSPLLSAANEPLHRPNRSRRPQPPPNRIKFNPFRMLG